VNQSNLDAVSILRIFCLGNQIPKYSERGRVIERSEGGGSGTWLSAQWKTRVSLPLAARASSGIRASKLPLAKWCEPAT
jgi:hypothetical protein